MGRPRKYKPIKIPSSFSEMDSYIGEHKVELMEHVLTSIEHAIKNDLEFIEIINFKKSDYVITLTQDLFLENVDHIYDEYIREERYELCQRVVDLQDQLLEIL